MDASNRLFAVGSAANRLLSPRRLICWAIIDIQHTLREACNRARWKLGQEFQQSLNKATSPPARAERIEIDAEKLLAKYDAPVVGTTDEIVDQLATFEETCGYDDFVVFPSFNLAGMTPEEHEVQLRSFAEDVRPYFEDE